MLELIVELNRQKEIAAVEIRKFCKNKEVPLQERWLVAVAGSWAFPNDTSMVELDDLVGTEVCWYSDFGLERYQKQDLLCDDFVTRVAEATGPEDERTYYIEIKNSKRVTVEEVQEFVLQLGLASFQNDW
jgi:hypothetical protein